jgi:WXG100 family type VII secretion target
MVQQTSVDKDGMVAAQGTFQTALDETSGAFASMDGQIEALRASWTGEAAVIYGNAMNRWLEDFNVVNQALQAMLEKLSVNTGVYAQVHENTQQQANALGQQISAGNFSGLPGFPSA